ncbi:MAG TPA: hypothetical protein VE912_10010 [Bacteroidales bacterium]|nr:hypothetical protein [Bacteroidales bacterium]
MGINSDITGIKQEMKIEEIASLLDAQIICGGNNMDCTVNYAFASDLMSDVLTIEGSGILLITGLTNLQAVRTAEMADISHIVFVRDKHATEEMVSLAVENNMVLLECRYSMFKTAGILYDAGIKPLY